MKRTVLFVALALAGCARDPAEIQGVAFDQSLLGDPSCEALFADYRKTSTDLDRLTEMQAQKRNNDTVGVFLIGLPLASMNSTDIAGQIAVLKGRKAAIDTASEQRKCTVK